MKLSNRIFILFLAALGLVLWAAFQHTLSPAFPPNDSPETITAAWRLGIQHPPGYPLHTILGRLATVCWPVGSPAWRVNCLSSLMAVLACLGLALLVARLLRWQFPRLALAAAWGGALAGGAWLGLSRVFWQQATEAKGGIYLLNALATVLMLRQGLEMLLANRPEKARTAFWLWCLLAGLGLANHYPSLGACLPFLALPVLFSWRAGHLRGQDLLTGAGLLGLGLSVYLLLPLRAPFQPPVNLGNPVDWESFWFVVLRKGYSQNQWAGTPGLLEAQLQQWWKFTWNEGTFLLPLFAGAGVWALCTGAPTAQDPASVRGGRRMLAMVGGIFLVIFCAVILYNRNEPTTVWLLEVFLIPGQISLALLAGLGLARFLGSAAFFTRTALIFPALLLGLLWSTHLEYANRRGDFFYWDFGKDMLLCLPTDAVYIPEGDFYYMPLYYNKSVEIRRPDTALLHKNLLATLPGLNDLRRQKPELNLTFLNTKMRPGTTLLRGLLDANLARLPFLVGTYHSSITDQDLGAPGDPVALRLMQRGVLQQFLPRLSPDPPVEAGLATGPRFDEIPVSRRDQFVKNMLRWYRDSYMEQLRDLGALDQPAAGAKPPDARKQELIRRYRILANQVARKMEE